MYISVHSGRVEVLEADDYRRFHISADTDLSNTDVGDQLRLVQLGDIDGDHASIDIGTLAERLAEQPGYDAQQFEAMVAYASDHGWITDDGRSLRAHIVRGNGD